MNIDHLLQENLGTTFILDEETSRGCWSRSQTILWNNDNHRHRQHPLHCHHPQRHYSNQHQDPHCHWPDHHVHDNDWPGPVWNRVGDAVKNHILTDCPVSLLFCYQSRLPGGDCDEDKRSVETITQIQIYKKIQMHHWPPDEYKTSRQGGHELVTIWKHLNNWIVISNGK